MDSQDSGLGAVWNDLMYFGEDNELRRLIAETIFRIPESAGRFALRNCAFVSVGRVTAGITLPGRIGVDPSTERPDNQWLIVLAEVFSSREEAMGVIAHEIGHAWRGDDRLGVDTPEDCEIQTATLARDWGFGGSGADPEFHRDRESMP